MRYHPLYQTAKSVAENRVIVGENDPVLFQQRSHETLSN
jgi:hypothetical protein